MFYVKHKYMSSTTISDIAQEAGVSGTTVSLAFQPNSRIGDQTRQKVLAVAQRLKYVPNQAARSLRQQQTATIGMIVPDITDTFFASLVRECERVIRSRGFTILTAESQWHGSMERQAIDSMIESRVRGILMCSCEGSENALVQLEEHDVPVILLDTYPEGFLGEYVATDFTALGRMAAEHLWQIGARHPLLINAGDSRSQYSSLRKLEQGFVQFWDKKKITSNIEYAGLTSADGKAVVSHLLANNTIIDACFCINDAIALGVMDAMRAHPQAPPLALLGIDNSPAARLGFISLSSFSLPCMHMADIAATALLDKIEGNASPVHEHLFAELIIRDSTRQFHPPTSDH